MWKHNPEGVPVVEVFLSGKLASRLHPYQLEGVQFLYECVLGYRRTEIAECFDNNDETECVYGGILA